MLRCEATIYGVAVFLSHQAPNSAAFLENDPRPFQGASFVRRAQPHNRERPASSTPGPDLEGVAACWVRAVRLLHPAAHSANTSDSAPEHTSTSYRVTPRTGEKKEVGDACEPSNTSQCGEWSRPVRLRRALAASLRRGKCNEEKATSPPAATREDGSDRHFFSPPRNLCTGWLSLRPAWLLWLLSAPVSTREYCTEALYSEERPDCLNPRLKLLQASSPMSR